MKKQIAVLAVIALAGTVSVQAQSVLYNWTYSGDATGAGTLSVPKAAGLPDMDFAGFGYDYTILSFTQTSGTLNFSPFLNGTVNFLSTTAPTNDVQIASQFLNIGLYAGDPTNYDSIYPLDTYNHGNSNPVTHTIGESGTYMVDNNTFTLSIASVPEPSTIALMGLGLAGWLAARRRK